MKVIGFAVKGGFKKTESFLQQIKEGFGTGILDKYGKMGVEALEKATPVNTGLTASSWGYEIERKDGNITLYWTNDNIQDGVPIALILQLGHATQSGYYIQGTDYINPALKPVFQQIADEAWKEVTRV